MIALALGLIVGFGLALLFGRLKGRSHELTIALYSPLFVYIVAGGFSGHPDENLFVSTPLGDYQPGQLAGVQTFIALILALIYADFRGKRALTVDEFPSVSLLAWLQFALGIGLASSASPLLAVPGLALYIAFLLLSERNPFGWLRASPCSGELSNFVVTFGLTCLTDEEGLMVYRIRDTVIIGGRVPKEFPEWRKVVKCVVDVPEAGKLFRCAFQLLPLTLVLLGVLMGHEILTALVLTVLSVLLYFGLLLISVKRTHLAMRADCKEIMEEYSKFLRERKKGKFDIVID